jgi:hypothetical protein
MGKSEVLSHPFALSIERDRFASIRFLLLISILTRTCCSLAGYIDEFLEIGIMFEAGMDKVFCSQSIHFKVGFFLYGLGYPCQMENLIDALHSLC